MIYNWLAVYFFSMLGMFLFPVYGEEQWAVVPVLFALFGSVCFIAGAAKTATEIVIESRKTALLFLIPCAVAVGVFPVPYSLFLFPLLAATVLALMLPHTKTVKTLFTALVITGIVMALQTACLYPYVKTAARVHEWSLLDGILYPLIKLMGFSATYSQETVFIQTPREIILLVTSFEKLGIYPLTTFFAGSLVLAGVYTAQQGARAVIKQLLGVIVLLLLYVPARYVLMNIIFIDFGDETIFWKPLIVATSFLPLPFMTAWGLSEGGSSGYRFLIPQLKRSGYLLMCSAAIGCFALASLLWMYDPGIKKQGRILIDEYYSNWEWTDRKIDTDWYGIQSVYNYYCFGDFLRHYYTVDTLKEKLTQEKLAAHDVFMVKTPTTPFTEQEIQLLVDYVAAGGGLFLVGDHTNVFGTTININPLAQRFGIRFNYDGTYNLADNDLHPHKHNTLFRHPAIQEMPYFLFATSCSMQASLFAQDILTASNLKAIYLDYSRGGYFPDKKTEKNYTFGRFLQTVGLTYGKGRVVAFPDSTCFSNFYMYIPGKPEYALGVMNWLNRENAWSKLLTLGALVVLLASIGYLVTRIRKIHVMDAVAYVFFGGIAGLALGALVFGAVTKSFYTLPEEHTAFQTVGFENGHCAFRIPDTKLLHSPSIDYHTFYVWTQRLGYRPDLFSMPETGAPEYDVLVFMNPNRKLQERQLVALEAYVSSGGRLLIVDTPFGRTSTANAIVQRFGMKIVHGEYVRDADIFAGDRKVGTIGLCAPVEGGTPLLHLKDSKVFAATRQHGKGRIAVAACSPSFANKSMGETETIPDEKQQFLYKLEFWLLSGLMNDSFASFSTYINNKK